MTPDALFNLNDEELALAKAKKGSKNRLGLAVLLKYFQLEGHYPKHIKFVDSLMLTCIANQLAIRPSVINHFPFEGRSTERFRQEIRELTGYQQATKGDIAGLKAWLKGEIFPHVIKRSEQVEHAYTYFHERKLEPFTSKELERHVRSAHKQFEEKLFSTIDAELSDKIKIMMGKFLSDDKNGIDTASENGTSDPSHNLSGDTESDINAEVKFNELKKGIPGAKLKHVKKALEKIDCLKQLNLPVDILGELPEKLIKKYYQRVKAELPSNMNSYQPSIRYATFALFCHHRSQVFTDDLADLLLQLAHQVALSAEKFIDKKILSEVKRVDGKFDILYQLSSTALANPKGVIEDTIYPEVNCETLDNLVKELKYAGKWYDQQVQTKMRSLYSHAHRSKTLTLLESFKFETNLKDSQLLLNAIQLMLEHREVPGMYYPKHVAVPIEKVVPSRWLSAVVETEEKTQGNKKEVIRKVNRMNYELAVLETFSKQLRCKMIWIDGAYRYRNPSQDLPKDFDEKREHYYSLLGMPLNAQDFVSFRKKQLDESLQSLNDTILSNDKVGITKRNGGHIRISPYTAQAEPTNIKQLHREIKKEWPSINLMDILKESELDIEFTKLLQTVASRENLSEEVLRFRLLLCLYALGTNTGIKAVSVANNSTNESSLRYVKRKFITVDAVRQAIVKIINKTLAI